MWCVFYSCDLQRTLGVVRRTKRQWWQEVVIRSTVAVNGITGRIVWHFFRPAHRNGSKKIFTCFGRMCSIQGQQGQVAIDRPSAGDLLIYDAKTGKLFVPKGTPRAPVRGGGGGGRAPPRDQRRGLWLIAGGGYITVAHESIPITGLVYVTISIRGGGNETGTTQHKGKLVAGIRLQRQSMDAGDPITINSGVLSPPASWYFKGEGTGGVRRVPGGSRNEALGIRHRDPPSDASRVSYRKRASSLSCASGVGSGAA